jgi:predicted dehydrogenase
LAFQVAIIGAGRIGASLDHPQSPHILTHAHGYEASEGFEIVGFVDRDLEKAEDASTCWGGRAFDSIERLFEKQEVDVVSVCVPDELHYETLLALAKRPVKFIFLEKPAVRTAAEADVVRSLYAGLSIRVLVNYTRRFVPEIRKTRKAIKSGDYGTFLTGTGYYGKGLLHNGSHMVDLLQFLLGEVGEVKKISETADFYDDDPSVSALLTPRAGGVFHLRHIDCRKFDIFELDLVFERKRIRICELGAVMEEYSVGDDNVFNGYRTLNKDAEYSTEHRKAMQHAVADIRNNLERDEPLACTLEDALATVKTCSRILREQTG